MSLLRANLLALKACAVLLRLRRIEASRQRLIKLVALDSRDQLGAGKLLEVVDEFQGTGASSRPDSDISLAAA